MQSASEVWAYIDGLKAGAQWFNDGIDRGLWEPPLNPYPAESTEAKEWERGLREAFGDLEDAYYA